MSRMSGILLSVIVLVVFFSPTMVSGQEEGLDDVLSGFDDQPVITGPGDAVDEDLSEALSPPWLEFSGGVGLGASANFSHDSPSLGRTDHRGLSRLRSSFDLAADLKLAHGWQGKISGKTMYDAVYSRRGRDRYTDAVLDQYEDETEFTEVYLQGPLLPRLDLKTGRQIVVWGKSDNIRITDILNPLDNREPGVVDIRDLRLPVSMTRLDYYYGDWNLSGLMLHEARFNKDPVFGNDFYPGTSLPAPEEKPGIAWDNQEFGLAANGVFSGWDVSLYAARLWDDQAHAKITPVGMRLVHSRIIMLGAAVNIVQGSWLLKGEAAYLDGLEYSIAVGEKRRLDMLLGAEYTGFHETVLSFEAANRHIFSFDERLQPSPLYTQEDELQYVLRGSRDFFHDTLQISVLFSTFGLTGDDGAFQRFAARYDWSDATTMTAGVVFYQNGDRAMFRSIGDNDRLFAEARYSF